MITINLILVFITLASFYGGLLWWTIKSQTKRDKRCIFVSNKNGIKYRFVRHCWIPDESHNKIYMGWLMLRLEDTENILENTPIVFRLTWIKQNLKSLEEKEKEEKSCL